MSETSQGSRKAPRSHQAHWKDGTSADRQQKRLVALNEIARISGYKSWSSYETAVINKVVEISSEPRCPKCGNFLLEDDRLWSCVNPDCEQCL